MKQIESAYEHDIYTGIRVVFTDGTTALITMKSANDHGLLMPRALGPSFLPGLAGRRAEVKGHVLVKLDPPMSEPRHTDVALMDDEERERWRKMTPQERYYQ